MPSQALEVQSGSPRHFLGRAARGQVLRPPQSASVSTPSWCRSVHWAAQTRVPVWQPSALTQSVSILHFLPVTQVPTQLGPPQSRSVSPWLKMPPTQVAARHFLATQSRLTQSPPTS